ncbi:MAG: toll/interleukin-1 receptor domain-containing protein [Candidatus Electrothrix sp. ATG1]|nr:toll/interleukin-1 receptor domain-containing protein [Candidatus Electrothrix sp. ATG1]
MVKIFISHSSFDSELARMIAETFTIAMRLSHKDIRCTSVDGYRLSGGADTHNVLRSEILESEVFIALISQESLNSTYVLFELGARWGAGTYLVPLLAPGVPVDFLKGPLLNLNALRCDNVSQLHQLLNDVSEQLSGVTLEQPAAYQNKLDILTGYQMPKPKKTSGNLVTAKSEKAIIVNERQDEKDLNYEIIDRHCESEWPNDYSMRIHCVKQQREALSVLLQRSYDDISDDVIEQIRKDAAKEWPDDFVMRLHTEKEQVKSYRQLLNLD